MHQPVSEKAIEARLRDGVRAMGGKAYKLESPGNNGMPDRMVCMPGGFIFFVEMKASGRKSTPQQVARQRELDRLGFTVLTDVDSFEHVDRILHTLAYYKSIGYRGLSDE